MGKTVLFTGDSISDGNRYKEEKDRSDLNHQIGHSYVYVIDALIGSKYPEREIEFLNRGISGNRVIELYGRIHEDMIDLKPDVVSILVGVNDGPQAEHGHHATGDAYGKIYRMMLAELKEANPEVKIVLVEPFLGKNGPVYDKDYKTWSECIGSYQKEVRKIAEEFGAVFVPLQEIFDKACEKRDTSYWIWDGVHPTEAGHGLIARQWIKYAGYLLGENEDEIYKI